MQRGHKLAQPASFDIATQVAPERPCVDPGRALVPAAPSHRRPARSLPGLSPTSLIASVEEVAAADGADWLIWGNVGDRPVLFALEASAAAEMMGSMATHGTATAIVEPWQVMLERLD
ncbi:MAG TPA: hypothetical protein VFC97_04350 [Verrucomicrobiae bacterium]|nr:hypothetical protein [Verrucomicrobiae bacterium]